MKTMAVYQILNTSNGKRYIGSSRHLEWRWVTHKQQLKRGNHHSRHLQRAWDKYGEEPFIFEILEVVLDPSILLAREQYYLDLYQPWEAETGYNSAHIAGSNAGMRRSPEVKARISAALKGRRFTLEHRQRIASAAALHKHSLETKEKLRLIAKMRTPHYGTPCSPETRAKISQALSGALNPQYGKPLSEETRKKIGVKSKGRQTFKGHRHTVETKARMRESALGRTLSEEAKAKVGAANRGRKHTEEAKTKMREAARLRKESADQPQRATSSLTLVMSSPSAEAAAMAVPPTLKIQS